MNKSICVFCGASNDVPQLFLDAAWDFGRRAAKQGYTIVYGGGNTGLMGAVANGALSANGNVVGVFPDILKGREAEHPSLTVFLETKTMHERKQEMYNRSDAFVILPGGVGTLDEFFECLTLGVLGVHSKPIIIYNFMDYWKKLAKLIQSMTSYGFVRTSTAKSYSMVESVDDIFKALQFLK